MFSSIESALEDVKNGKVIIIVDNEDRENEGDFYVSARHATPENVNFMITKGKGLLCLTVDKNIANRLELDYMVSKNQDDFGTAFTFSIDHVSTTTGISASERSRTIIEAVNGSSTIKDFKKPGHIFPLIAKEKGVLVRQGHTEASVDLSLLSGHEGAGVICEIIKDDGEMARRDDLFELARENDLKIITIEDLIKHQKKNYKHLEKSEMIQLPTEAGVFDCIAYKDTLTGKEHLALFVNESDKTPMIRVHSECLTGDVFGSKKCDCGSQLMNALEKIKEHGSGALIYLRQEGRDIGLLNKINAYKLQQEGQDTVEANLSLGFDIDHREYHVGAAILKDLGYSKINLLTNSPDKIRNLDQLGIELVETTSLSGKVVSENLKYLKTKIEKLNHSININ